MAGRPPREIVGLLAIEEAVRIKGADELRQGNPQCAGEDGGGLPAPADGGRHRPASRRFGMHPDGTVLPIDKLTHLSADQATAARRLRELSTTSPRARRAGADRRQAAYDRMVLEISFTALNRLAALRLARSAASSSSAFGGDGLGRFSDVRAGLGRGPRQALPDVPRVPGVPLRRAGARPRRPLRPDDAQSASSPPSAVLEMSWWN